MKEKMIERSCPLTKFASKFSQKTFFRAVQPGLTDQLHVMWFLPTSCKQVSLDTCKNLEQSILKEPNEGVTIVVYHFYTLNEKKMSSNKKPPARLELATSRLKLGLKPT